MRIMLPGTKTVLLLTCLSSPFETQKLGRAFLAVVLERLSNWEIEELCTVSPRVVCAILDAIAQPFPVSHGQASSCAGRVVQPPL